MKISDKKYPVEKVNGVSIKYDELIIKLEVGI